MEQFFTIKTNRVIAAVVLVLAGIALLSYAYGNYHMTRSMYPMPMSISVTGEGEVRTIPDVGQFSFSVVASGTEASSAQEASATKIADIMAYLKEQGVEEKDIKTENYSLYPKYRYETPVCTGMYYCPPGEEIADGFEVSQTIAVKVRDTAKAGAMIAGAGEKGATNISGLTFTVDDTSKLKTEARSKAIADAKVKAEKIAADLGVEIVRVTSFYESEGYYPEPYGYGGEMMMDAKAESFEGPSTPMGENLTKVQVNLSYEVRE